MLETNLRTFTKFTPIANSKSKWTEHETTINEWAGMARRPAI